MSFFFFLGSLPDDAGILVSFGNYLSGSSELP